MLAVLFVFVTVLFCEETQLVPAEEEAVSKETMEETPQIVLPEPPGRIFFSDTPDDGGTSLDLYIEKSADDLLEGGKVIEYIIYRKGPGEENYSELKSIPSWTLSFLREKSEAGGQESSVSNHLKEGRVHFVDNTVRHDIEYHYMVRSSAGEGFLSEPSEMTEAAVATAQWFNRNKTLTLIATVLFFILIIYFLRKAKTDADKLYIRRIPGVDAIEEAIGRATEMGRPVLFVPGIGDISIIQTIASLLILGEVAEKTASYASRIIVPNMIPFVMTVAQEVVKQSYAKAGTPEAYDEDDVMFLTQDQFAYAAAVNGIMLREKPAAVLLLGQFYAESLLLAETGYASGAIQVAGTAEVTQLPFFIAACDYTLLGEELFAASAYLSREPKILSTLKAADWFKAAVVLIIILGSIVATIAPDFLAKLLEFGA